MSKNSYPNETRYAAELVVLASERTLLSWMRLSLTLMALGFILDRFGIFLHMENVDAPNWISRNFTTWMGIGLLVVGAATSAAAGYTHTRLRRRYARRGIHCAEGALTLGIVLVTMIGLVGIITALFLFAISPS